MTAKASETNYIQPSHRLNYISKVITQETQTEAWYDASVM